MLHPSDMEGLAGLEENNSRIDEEWPPRGLGPSETRSGQTVEARMEDFGGGGGGLGGGGVNRAGGSGSVQALSPAAVAWHTPASGRTDSSCQCQVACSGC